MKNKLTIVSSSAEYIPEIVRIHCESLPDDFLPRLGVDFLEKTFYPAVIESKNAELSIELDETQNVCGFILTTCDSGAFLSGIIKDNFFSFLKVGLRNSLQSLKNFTNNIQIIFSSLFSRNDENSGEIYIIAVEQSLRGRGTGRRMVNASKQFLMERGVPSIKIKTLESNTDWIDFFKKDGWMQSANYELIGNNYVELKKKL